MDSASGNTGGPGNGKKPILVFAIAGTVLFFSLVGVMGFIAINAIGKFTASTVASQRSEATPADGGATDVTSTQAPSELPDHAPAGTAIAGTIVNDSLAPFQLKSCAGVLSAGTDDNGQPASKLWVSVTIHDSAAKPFTATQVAIGGVNGHGEAIVDSETSLGTFLDDDDETIAPGTDYDSTGTFQNANPSIRKITCTQSKAAYSDGTSWARVGSH